MATLTLWLRSDGSITLERAAFKHPVLGSEQRCVRGKTSGALDGYGVFGWTPAVHAMTILALKHHLYGSLAPNPESEEAPRKVLLGEHASAASSLDYALAKGPAWILDMFGVDSRGRSLARRLVLRSNPERKRPGPVILAINPHVLTPQDIKVFLDDKEMIDKSRLSEVLDQLEKSWPQKVAPIDSANRRAAKTPAVQKEQAELKKVA